jgi:hypothetical protein
MKFTNAFSAALALTLATPALAETPATPAIDFAKINTQIQSVIDQTFQADDVLKGISFRVNPKTADLEKLKLDALLTASAKTSPWAENEKTTLKFSVKSKAGAPLTNGKVPVAAQAQAGFQTQVLQFVQFIAQKAAARLDQPSDPAALPAYQKLVAVLASLEKAGSLNDIYPALVQLKQVLLERNKDTSDEQVITKIEVSSEVVDGNTRSIAIRYRDTVEFFGMKFKNIGVKLDDSTILGGFIVTAKFPQAQVNEVRNDIREELVKIQDGDADTMDKLKDTVQGWSMMAKDMLQNLAD